jgi:hypothetical protein
MVHNMIGTALTHRIVTLVLALGMFLGGAAPSWAISATPQPGKDSMPGMTMPAMAMQGDCMGMMAKNTHKDAPCQRQGMGCAVCVGCALPVAMIPDSSRVQLTYRELRPPFSNDVNPNGIAVLPALPPPILHA